MQCPCGIAPKSVTSPWQMRWKHKNEKAPVPQGTKGGGADLLYFANDGTLQVGQWNDEIDRFNYRNVLAFFKFGSIVGFDVNDAWDDTKVKFNPVPGSPAYVNYANIPSFVAADYDGNYGPSVSSDVYHKISNLKLGKGDPCMLVGLTPAEIQSASTLAELEALQSADERGWRLPTAVENAYFVDGRTNWAPGDGVYTLLNTTYNYWTANGSNSDNPGAASLPVVDTPELTAKSQILPATGARVSNGNVAVQGEQSNYLLSTPYNASQAYFFYFTVLNVGSVYTSNAGGSFSAGNSIRCVRP